MDLLFARAQEKVFKKRTRDWDWDVKSRARRIYKHANKRMRFVEKNRKSIWDVTLQEDREEDIIWKLFVEREDHATVALICVSTVIANPIEQGTNGHYAEEDETPACLSNSRAE